MAESNIPHDLSRRTFIKTGVAAAAVAGWPANALGEDDAESQGPLPTRGLGQSNIQVSMLNLGAGRAPNERMLNASYDLGVRYIDTADCYAKGASEKAVADWMEKTGRREEYFIVTKDHPSTPDDWVRMIDRRLEKLRTDYVDLFFVHGLGGGFRGKGDESVRDVPKMKEWGAAAEKMKKAGKVRLAGFSTHTTFPLRTDLLNNAAVGGWVDAIMVAYDPKLVRENAEFNKALDACHKAGIGLICMKEMRGVGKVEQAVPKFKEMGLTPHQAVLHAVWSDERFASICSEMPNLKILKANASAARNFKPLDDERIGAVIDLYDGALAAGYCNGCDGRCARAAGTKASLGDITRALSYHEQDGLRDDARTLYASLTPEERDWHGADLDAAKHACLCKLDFASLLPRAEQKLT